MGMLQTIEQVAAAHFAFLTLTPPSFGAASMAAASAGSMLLVLRRPRRPKRWIALSTGPVQFFLHAAAAVRAGCVRKTPRCRWSACLADMQQAAGQRGNENHMTRLGGAQ